MQCVAHTPLELPHRPAAAKQNPRHACFPPPPTTDLDRIAASASRPSWDATMGPSVENDDITDLVEPAM